VGREQSQSRSLIFQCATAILALSVIGAFIFGGALALSWLNPLLVERAAREVVRIEVERRVGERIDELSESKIADFARGALRKTGVEIGGYPSRHTRRTSASRG
jgi:hypothetical protein